MYNTRSQARRGRGAAQAPAAGSGQQPRAPATAVPEIFPVSDDDDAYEDGYLTPDPLMSEFAGAPAVITPKEQEPSPGPDLPGPTSDRVVLADEMKELRVTLLRLTLSMERLVGTVERYVGAFESVGEPLG